MKGSIKGGVIEVLDDDRRCKFMGTLPTLFDFGANCGITLEVTGKTFFGRDRKSDRLFGGTVEGQNVRLHDYGEARDFFYEL